MENPILEPAATIVSPVQTASAIGGGNLVFVAMPHSGDKWTSFELELTPGHTEACPG